MTSNKTSSPMTSINYTYNIKMNQQCEYVRGYDIKCDECLNKIH